MTERYNDKAPSPFVDTDYYFGRQSMYLVIYYGEGSNFEDYYMPYEPVQASFNSQNYRVTSGCDFFYNSPYSQIEINRSKIVL